MAFLVSVLSFGALLFSVSPSWAHKASDAYLQLDVSADAVALRVDVALRDLDNALDLDADADSRLTWGEVRAAWPRILAYAAPRIGVAGCTLRPADAPGSAASAPALEARSDGVYAVLRYAAPCRVGTSPTVRYALLADVDPTHRGIARVSVAGGPPVLSVLDPTHPAARVESAGSAGSAASSAPATGHAGAGGFVVEGMRHIVGGYDHVLFLVCLILPAVLRRQGSTWQPVTGLGHAIWPVAGIVTAFTVAHSITLTLAALRLVELPASFIEPAIAATIVLAAIDNLRPWFPAPRAVVAFLFGLVHGFGFANVLGELDLPAAHFAWALLQFNLGLEIGQLAIVATLASLLYAIRRWPGYRRVVLTGGSCVAIGLATAWFVERVAGWRLLPF